MNIKQRLTAIAEANQQLRDAKFGLQDEIATALNIDRWQVRIQSNLVVIEMDPERKYKQRLAAEEYAKEHPKYPG